jgi:hypothetical protein
LEGALHSATTTRNLRVYQLRPACQEAQRAHAAAACAPQCSLGIRGRRPSGAPNQLLESPDLLSLPCREEEEEEEEEKEKEKERDGAGGHLFEFSDTIEVAGGR